MVASVRSGRRSRRLRARSTSKACGEVTSCTRCRSTYSTAGESAVSGTTTCRSQTLSKSVRGGVFTGARSSDRDRPGGRDPLLAPGTGDGVARCLDLIDDDQESSHGRFHDVGGDRGPAVRASAVLNRDDRLALCILAHRYAPDLELAQLYVHARRVLDGLEGGIDRSVAGRCGLGLPTVGVAEHHPGAAGGGGVALHVQTGKLPRTVASLASDLQHERLDVAVEQLLLLVGERLEVVEDPVQLRVIELETELADALTKGVAAAVLAEH